VYEALSSPLETMAPPACAQEGLAFFFTYPLFFLLVPQTASSPLETMAPPACAQEGLAFFFYWYAFFCYWYLKRRAPRQKRWPLLRVCTAFGQLIGSAELCHAPRRILEIQVQVCSSSSGVSICTVVPVKQDAPRRILEIQVHV
jgi:hypothetical protein